MADIIALLERIGRDTSVKMGGVDAIVLEAALDEETLTALLSPQSGRLEELLGARVDLFCGQHPAKEDEDDEESDAPPDDDEEEESPNSEQRSSARVAAN